MIRKSLFAMLALVLFTLPAAALDAAAVKSGLATTYEGSFRWKAEASDQKVTISFDNVIDGAVGKVWAFGKGVYVIPERTTTIRVKALIDPRNLKLQMWELDPDKQGFVTDGSHKGKISEDLKTIEAVWTSSDGATGDLKLGAR